MEGEPQEGAVGGAVVMVEMLMLPKSCGHKTLSSGSHNPLAFFYSFFLICYSI